MVTLGREECFHSPSHTATQGLKQGEKHEEDVDVATVFSLSTNETCEKPFGCYL